ncbi:MAG TPA: hypothetical protein VH165_14720 [Kofleriaceae bacterium]|nr:hypothetical protein [Kofleriaceae bacterium]
MKATSLHGNPLDAHQVFPANAASAGDTARAARTMLQMLPDRLALPRTAAN